MKIASLLCACSLMACAQHRQPSANRQVVIVEDPRAKAIAEYNASLPKSAWTQEWDQEPEERAQESSEITDPAIAAILRDMQAIARVLPDAPAFEPQPSFDPTPHLVPIAGRSRSLLPRSYTMRNNIDGGYTIENDFDPMDSHTVTPRFDGGYTIENDFSPLDTIEVRRAY